MQDEQRRSKELLQRIEREKQLQLENAAIRLQNADSECEKQREEISRQRLKLDKLEQQREDLANQVQDLQCDLTETRDEAKACKDRENRSVTTKTLKLSDQKHDLEQTDEGAGIATAAPTRAFKGNRAPQVGATHTCTAHY